MGHANWVVITLRNHSGDNILVTNVHTHWGKFYQDENKDDKVDKTDVEGTAIVGGGSFVVSACGQNDSPTGTKGSFDVVEQTTGTIIRTVSWDCPFTGKNAFHTDGENETWRVEHSEVSKSGALGEVTVTFVKL